jgi:hypothetical protein
MTGPRSIATDESTITDVRPSLLQIQNQVRQKDTLQQDHSQPKPWFMEPEHLSSCNTTVQVKEEPENDDEAMDDAPSRPVTPDDDPSISNFSWITSFGGLLNAIDDAVPVQW